MVSSGIEPLIPALLARCLNQLGQETNNLYSILILRMGYHSITRFTNLDIELLE